MPRVLAALIAELVAVAVVVVLVVVVVVPPLLRGFGAGGRRAAGAGTSRGRARVDFQAQLGELPEPVRTILLTVATDVVANLQGAIRGFADGAADFITSQILGIFETASFVFGLLVIPVWVLTIVKEREIKRTMAAAFSPGLRPDAVAMLRIVDRGLSTFIRVQVLQRSSRPRADLARDHAHQCGRARPRSSTRSRRPPCSASCSSSRSSATCSASCRSCSSLPISGPGRLRDARGHLHRRQPDRPAPRGDRRLPWCAGRPSRRS